MQQTIQIGQMVQPSVLSQLKAVVKNLKECMTVQTARQCVGGAALMGGMVLATGADTLPQAILTLAAFAVAGACFRVEEEKGGAA